MGRGLTRDAHSADDGATVLVVEDDADVRALVRDCLEDDGLTVEVVRDGRQALEHAARRRPGLVILDWRLPALSGEGVAAGLRALYGATLPIVLVTAETSVADKAALIGAFASLSK